MPYFSAFGGPLPGVDPSNYYGYHNIDKQEIDVDMLTGVIEHDFSDSMTLRSLARFQQVDQLSVVDAPQGTWCLASGINPATGLACPRPLHAGQLTSPAVARAATSRDTTQRHRHQPDRPDLALHHRLGRARAGHRRVVLARELRPRHRQPAAQRRRHARPTLPLMSIANPDSLYTGPINPILIGRSEGTLDNQAIYAFDTLEFNEQWLLNLGARYEHNEGDSVAWNVKTYTAPTAANPRPDNSNIGAILGRAPVADNEDDLFSYRAGLVFKPVENGTIYLSYANSKTPSKASVNGSCTRPAPPAPPTATSTRKPRSTIELGTKWDYRQPPGADRRGVPQRPRELQGRRPGQPGQSQRRAAARRRGARRRRHRSASPARSPTTGRSSPTYTYLDSEVLQGVSDFCLANPSTACGNTAADPDPLKGRAISGTPERSGSLWTTYDLNQLDLRLRRHLPEQLRVLHRHRRQRRRHQGLHHPPRDGRLSTSTSA